PGRRGEQSLLLGLHSIVHQVGGRATTGAGLALPNRVAAKTRSAVAAPANMSQPELWPTLPATAIDVSTLPDRSDETPRYWFSSTCPAAAAARKQRLSGDVDCGAAPASACARAACALRCASASSIASMPMRKSSPDGVNPGPRPTRP